MYYATSSFYALKTVDYLVQESSDTVYLFCIKRIKSTSTWILSSYTDTNYEHIFEYCINASMSKSP